MKRLTPRDHKLSMLGANLDAIVRQTYHEIITDPYNSVKNYDDACTFICDESAEKITKKLNNLFSHMGITSLRAVTEWHDPYLLDNSLDLDHIFTTVGDPKDDQEELIVVDATYLQFLPENRRLEDPYPYAFVGSRDR